MSKRPLCQGAVWVVLGVLLYEKKQPLLLLPIAVVILVASQIYERCISKSQQKSNQYLLKQQKSNQYLSKQQKEKTEQLQRKRHIFYMALVSILCLLIGMYRGKVCQPGPLEVEDGEAVTLQGVIYDRQEKEDKTVYYVEDISLIQSGNLSDEGASVKETAIEEASAFKGSCIAYYSGEDTFSIGNTVLLTGRLSVFEKATNPGQFDAKAYYRSVGIDFAVFQADIEVRKHQKDTIKEGLYSIRQKLHNQLDKLAGEHASVLQAMLLGEKSQMDSEIKELYQRSGISHILVISGLHFSLLGMTLYGMLRRVGASFGVGGGISVLVLFLYGIMTGFGVSAVRAFVMFAIMVGGDILGRGYDLPSALGASVIYLVWDNPFVIYQTGFLLSVGAIIGIAVFIPVLEILFCQDTEAEMGSAAGEKEDAGKVGNDSVSGEKEGNKRNERNKWWMVFKKKGLQLFGDGVKSGVAIQLVTFPVLLYSFYEFSPYSILLNCLVLPLVPVVILCSIAALGVSMLCYPLSSIVLLPSVRVLDFYELLCNFTGKLPAATLVVGKPQIYEIVIYYMMLASLVVGAWLVRKKDFNEKLRKVSRMAFVGGAAVLWSFLVILKDTKGMEISMLDVGQGQSVYIRCGGSDVLYDGGSTDVSNVGQYRIVPFLKAKGVDEVELVIISHMDADHYNGISQMLSEELIVIKCLMLPLTETSDETYWELVKLAEEKGVLVQFMEKQDCFTIEDTRFRVLHPYNNYNAESTNDTSIVLSMEYGEFTMLFTGDVEKAGENAMLSSDLLEKVDVLQVAHHGSSSSTTEEFLKMVSPDMAWISCGEGNRYGHPSKDVLKRLTDNGCRYYVTMEEGCITMKLAP